MHNIAVFRKFDFLLQDGVPLFAANDATGMYGSHQTDLAVTLATLFGLKVRDRFRQMFNYIDKRIT